MENGPAYSSWPLSKRDVRDKVFLTAHAGVLASLEQFFRKHPYRLFHHLGDDAAMYQSLQLVAVSRRKQTKMDQFSEHTLPSFVLRD